MEVNLTLEEGYLGGGKGCCELLVQTEHALDEGDQMAQVRNNELVLKNPDSRSWGKLAQILTHPRTRILQNSAAPGFPAAKP